MAFQPLQLAKREVRLLRVSPGFWNEAIKLKLDIVSLDAGPHYRALSYAWGSATQTRRVTLGDHPFDVTTSLFNALRRLRKVDEVTDLWVDAVYINQDNNKERSEQVSLMGRVYASAVEVLIWLGDTIPRGPCSTQPLRVPEGCLDEGRECTWMRENIEQLVTSDVFDTTETEALAACAFSVLHLLADLSTHWDSKRVFALDDKGGSFVVAKDFAQG